MLITSAVSLVSFWAAGRFIKPRFRKVSMFIGAAMVVAIILPFSGKWDTALYLFSDWGQRSFSHVLRTDGIGRI